MAYEISDKQVLTVVNDYVSIHTWQVAQWSTKIRDVALFLNKATTGKTRKDLVTPAINHPLSVLRKLSSKYLDCEVYYPLLATALLHDVIEDNGVTYGKLKKEFGKEIADNVRELSYDTKTYKSKDDYIAQVSQTRSPDVLLVKAADRLCNIYDYMKVDACHAAKYLKKAEPIVRRLNSEFETNSLQLPPIKHSALNMLLTEYLMLDRTFKNMFADPIETKSSTQAKNVFDLWFIIVRTPCLCFNEDGRNCLIGPYSCEADAGRRVKWLTSSGENCVNCDACDCYDLKNTYTILHASGEWISGNRYIVTADGKVNVVNGLRMIDVSANGNVDVDDFCDKFNFYRQ